PGLYARGSSATDVALVAVQAAPVSPDDLWQAILPQFGLDAVPEPIGDDTSPTFEWTLYQFDAEFNGTSVRFDVATAENDGKTYLILLQASPEEYETLHNEVFTPMLDTITLLEAMPVPYPLEEVTFTNGDVTLAGTLTLPEGRGPHPAVVLMTGSGPQDRNEEVVPGFRIFEQIADHLTRAGVAVLRYDDRGVGESTGDYAATSIYDFASDGLAAVDYLRAREDIDPAQVGVLGHSEGGIYAAQIGANPDSGVAFIISVAGTAVPGEELLLHQSELILRSTGASQELIDSQRDFLIEAFPLIAARDWEAVEQLTHDALLEQWEFMTDEQHEQLGSDAEAFAESTTATLRQSITAEWYPTVIEYNPAPDWAQTTVPVLGIFGGKDVQVDDQQNAEPLAEALEQAGNEDFEIIVLPDANHLFQAAETGGLEEYAMLGPEFTPDFLPTISDWLLAHVDIPE
ncbi:MAG: alpha/beta fold hydrolase, partial [Burkholderiales bacterium]|nr:alpha/beta fold hydrolase [Anaerolineae bacterium]